MSRDKLTLNEYYDDAGDWGYDRYISSIASRNRYIVISFISILIALCSVTALVIVLPLKTTVPVIIDRNELSQMHQATLLDASEFKSDALIDLGYIETYFLLRERYDYSTYEEDNYKVQLWGAADISKLYLSWWKKESGFKKLGKNGVREVFRKSIIALEDDRYQVRFSTRDVVGGTATKFKHWVSIIEFTYTQSNIPTNDRDVYINTVGFMVTKYTKQRERQTQE